MCREGLGDKQWCSGVTPTLCAQRIIWAVLTVPGIKVGLDMCKAITLIRFTSPTQIKFLLLLQVRKLRLGITAQDRFGTSTHNDLTSLHFKVPIQKEDFLDSTSSTVFWGETLNAGSNGKQKSFLSSNLVPLDGD